MGHHLASLIDEAFERFGDREATYFEGAWYRSGELHDRARRIGRGLQDLGVAPGERVVVFMSNTPDVGVVYEAIWRAGAVVTPAIFLLPPPELRHVLEDSGGAAIVTTPEFLDTVRTAADGVETLRHVICVGGGDDVVDLDDLAAGDPGSIVHRDDGDLAALLYTGGTTGRAKGVMLSHENYWRSSKAIIEATYVPDRMATLVPLPLSHAYGLGVTLARAHLPQPNRSVLMRWFDPVGFLDLVESLEVDRVTVVPSMLQMLLTQPLEERDLSSLTFVASGASPLPREVAEAWERRVPNALIYEGYGCTESATFGCSNVPGARRLGTVGRPIPGVEVRTVDEDGQPVGAGEAGELALRSRGVMQGYWNAPGATATALRDGWLHTGDIASIDADGYVTILDRKKDLIIRGGFNVYPSDVEEALLEHPDVEGAGVVGAPDPEHGEEVVAFVTLRAGATTTGDELVAWSRERLGGYKYPRRIHVVDQIPLTPVLKIDRKALRAQVTRTRG